MSSSTCSRTLRQKTASKRCPASGSSVSGAAGSLGSAGGGGRGRGGGDFGIGLLLAAVVATEFPVQCRWIDPEHFGGAGLVAPFALEHPRDVGLLDHVERRVLVEPFCNQRLGLALADLIGNGRAWDGVALGQRHG